jgi:hypothetical protein
MMRKRGKGGGKMIEALRVSDMSLVVKCRGCTLGVSDVSLVDKCRGCTLGVGDVSSVAKCRGCALWVGHESSIGKCRGCVLRDRFLNLQFNTSKRTLKAVRQEGNLTVREEAGVGTGNHRTAIGRSHPPEGNPTVREEAGLGHGDAKEWEEWEGDDSNEIVWQLMVVGIEATDATYILSHKN